MKTLNSPNQAFSGLRLSNKLKEKNLENDAEAAFAWNLHTARLLFRNVFVNLFLILNILSLPSSLNVFSKTILISRLKSILFHYIFKLSFFVR